MSLVLNNRAQIEMTKGVWNCDCLSASVSLKDTKDCNSDGQVNACVPTLKILHTVKTLNIGTPRPATVVVLNIKPLNFTMKYCLQ